MTEKNPTDNVDFDISIQPPKESDVDPEKAQSRPDVELTREASHISHHDLGGAVAHGHVEADAEQYERFSSHRKVIITCVISICGFLAPISSTTVLAAIPEVAATFHTSGTIINVSNALYLAFMGISPCFWGPLSQIYGRRWVSRHCTLHKRRADLLTMSARSVYHVQHCFSRLASAQP